MMYIVSSVLSLGFTGWLLVVAVFLLSRWFLGRRSSGKQPPGPLSLPLLGNLLSVSDKDLRKAFARLANKYGDVMQIDLGYSRTIVLSSYDAMKDALLKQGQVFAFRPQEMMPDCRRELGISVQNQHWNEHKRFILHTFRDFGIGKNKMELMIQEELSILLRAMSENANKPTVITDFFSKLSSNVILRLVFGRRWSYDDPQLIKHARLIEETGTLEESLLTNCYPFLKHLPGDLTNHKRINTILLELRDMATGWIEERKKTVDYNGEPRDLIEAYLQEQKSNVNSSRTGFTDEMLAWHVLDLHAAAADTVTSTLTFAVYDMILNPDVQERVYKEIDEVVGSRQPSLHDRANMPYTEAVLSEVQRLADVVPFALTHSNNIETTIKGYTIPQWSNIMMNVHYVLRDPSVWPDPEKFDPNRFLDSFGKYKKRDELIPFGLGKRNCVGENLARSELFLVFVGVIQHFSFRTPDGAPKPDPEGTMGQIVHPKPVEIFMEPRNTI